MHTIENLTFGNGESKKLGASDRKRLGWLCSRGIQCNMTAHTTKKKVDLFSLG